MADWLPGWTPYLFNLRGKPYQFTHNPKGCLHTTEGSSIAGALSAYAPYPPHGIYDWRSRERLQHIPLSLASYSAMDGNDDDYMIQIELVGFAAESRFWPAEAWRNIAEDVIKPIEDHFGVPRRALGFKDARDGISPPLATASSPIRLGWAALRDYSGWLGHQHLPAPDEHWDPGAIQISRAFELIGGSAAGKDDDMPVLAVGDVRTKDVYKITTTPKGTFKEWIRSTELLDLFEKSGATVVRVRQAFLDGLWDYVEDDAAVVRKQMDALTAKVDSGFGKLADDEANIISALRSLPTGGQVDIPSFVAALVPALAPALPQGVTVDQLQSTLVDTLNSVRLSAGG
jgi:hypothetical protein